MSRTLILAVLALMIGTAVGSGVANALAQRHQHTRAVMWLLQFHLDEAAAAARAGDCQRLSAERARLGRLYEELLQAFPDAYRQDARFRTRADALRDAAADAAQTNGVAGTGCSDEAATLKRLRDACDACHRQYRD